MNQNHSPSDASLTTASVCSGKQWHCTNWKEATLMSGYKVLPKVKKKNFISPISDSARILFKTSKSVPVLQLA